MDKGGLEEQRRQAGLRVQDLRQELAAIAESTAEGPDDEHDAEGSTIGYERARVKALLAHAERAAEQLAAVADRTPGTARCERCGDIIPSERIDALPGTRTCVDCARLS